MNLPSARSTATNSRAVAVAGLSSEIRGLRPVEFSLRVAQRSEHRGLSPEVDGSSPSPQELAVESLGVSPITALEKLELTARQFPSVAIIGASTPTEARMRRVSHEFRESESVGAVTGGNSL